MLGGATSGLGSPAVRSSLALLMHPILRLSILCGRAGHQSADLTPAPRPPRRAPGHFPYDGESYRAGERIITGFVESTLNQVIGKRSCNASSCREPHTGRISYDRSARACEIATGSRHSGSGIQGSVPPPANGGAPPRINLSPVQRESGDAPPTGVDAHG